ncbi:MAG: class I SAM-dependent methyltransferase [Salibacteraceae bacterium]
MDYKEINRKLWNDKVDAHLNSKFYNVDEFIKGQSVLNDIELELLQNVSGKSVLHLQCHFGQDSIELSRMGARVGGVDLSDRSIEKAKWLAKQCGTSTEFICCDVYESVNQLDESFDTVFTSYGTVGWLPDIQRWAHTVNHFLKPGGAFVIADFHPVIWMMDEEFSHVTYGYFNSGPIIENQSGTYADRNAEIHNTEVSWNHSLSDIMGALLDEGLMLKSFKEYDYSPYPCFKNLVETRTKQFQIEGLEGKLPMVYSMRFEKPIV